MSLAPELEPAAYAIAYLRVSTISQMNTAIDIDADGNSIATQRVFVQRRAAGLGAIVVKEFVEPGNSAASIEKRPVFRDMLTYLAANPQITHVIVYMRSRAFRNYTDAAITKRQLAKRGVKLLSAKEDFGEGYIADAMEGIIDIFNELESRRNGEDIKAKMRNKVLGGGSLGRAKLGYLNIRAEEHGRLYNSIGLDEQRAPLIRHAFELYASGDYPLHRLADTMADLGLTTRPTKRHPEELPVCNSKLHQILKDPYYAGWVSVDGELIPGRHTAIVSQPLFDRVQDVMAERAPRGTRDRLLMHPLRGTLWCYRCSLQGRSSRLLYTEAKGRNGQRYGYFKCSARANRLCNLPHLPAWQVEDAIARHCDTLKLPEDFVVTLRQLLDEALADQQRLTRELDARLREQLARLEAREARLIDLAADGLLPRDKILERSNAIKVERNQIEASLTDTTAELALGATRLTQCLAMLSDPAQAYAQGSDAVRRKLNQTFFERFYLDDDAKEPIVRERLVRQPYREIHAAAQAHQTASPDTDNAPGDGATNAARPGGGQAVLADVLPARVSSNGHLVELAGIEPASSSVEPSLLRVQSVMSLFSAPVLAQTRHRRAQPTRCPSCSADSGTR